VRCGTGTELDKPFVGTNGVAHDITVTNSLRLGPDEDAVKSLQTWKVEPATLDGKPVALKIAVQVDFRLFRRS
jgi:hypothetical protein